MITAVSRSIQSRSAGLTRAKPGFALVVAISLMAFMLLLLLSLSTLLTVEVATTQQSKAQLIARENARLGLMAALGELQRLAGPDTKVTARAEIIGDTISGGNRYWTGVWDATNLSVAPIWLVSGNNPNPLTTEEDAHALVGHGSVGAVSANPDAADQVVSASPVEIPGNGAYAWWVSDEGVKANIGAGRKLDASLTTAEARRAADYQLGTGAGLSAFGWAVDLPFAGSGSIDATYDRLLSPHQVTLASDGNPDIPLAHFHAMTTHSLGVQQRPAGGLKQNLAEPTVMADSLFGDAGNRYLQADTALRRSSSWIEPGAAGEAYFDPVPIPTEIALKLGLFHSNADGNGKIRARFHVQLEFWNPYNRPLRFPWDSDPNLNRALYVEFENLPTVTVEQVTGIPILAPTITFNMDAMINTNIGSVPDPIKSWVEVMPDFDRGRNPEPGFLPGEIYEVLEPNPQTQAQGLARDVINYTTHEELAWKPGPGADPGTLPQDDAVIRSSLVLLEVESSF